MRKTLTTAMALVMMAGTVGVAGAASAQQRPGGAYEAAQQRGDRADRRGDRRDDRADRRGDRRDDRFDRRDDRRDDRFDRREDRRDDRAQRQQYNRWQAAQRRYAAGRYYAPRGYQTRTWGYGQRMPYQYRTIQYVIRDYNRYGLYAPPSGYQYVRSGNDVVLAAVATGLITAVIAGLFQ